MKMPSINIAFKEKGISAVERSERGIVLLILVLYFKKNVVFSLYYWKN